MVIHDLKHPTESTISQLETLLFKVESHLYDTDNNIEEYQKFIQFISKMKL